MDKKAYIRTMEAILAIIIIFIFIFTILPRQEQQDIEPRETRLLRESILNEIGRNETFRQQVLNDNNSSINVYVGQAVSLVGNYGFIANIQDANAGITQPSGLPDDKSVYADSIVISSNLQTLDPKVVTLYIWEK